MELPQEFSERMKKMLGGEYEDFLAAYEKPRNLGLRVNTLKISAEEFARLAPFHLTPIPWIENGFYYQREDDPARHPLYYAGLYYLQEPSAMTPASILPVTPGEYVLDLCAAPGGKATALAEKLQGQGLLAANDISASRAKALLKNLEIFGVKNSFVTNCAPHRLAEQFGEYFDKILVDAPCSGEGMFRKDIASVRAWGPQKVGSCAAIQKEITRQAVKMLRPGGLMLYSTCTFAPEENEAVIAQLLKDHPELEVQDIPWYEGFAHGLLPEDADLPASFRGCVRTGAEGIDAGDACQQRNVLCGEENVPCAAEELYKCVRIFPHKMNGEGHFLALLKKRGELPGVHETPTRRGGRPTREEEKLLREFLEDVTMPWSMDQIEVRAGQAYLVQVPPGIRGGIPFLRNGLYLGELKKNRFEPSQSLAMALRCEEYVSVLDFDQNDGRVLRYLHGETIQADDMTPGRPAGWQLVCVCGYPLGWGKLSGGTLKNRYHPGWRMGK